MRQEKDQLIDAVGVGIGPFNLSVAALIQPVKEVSARFFDREEEFQWQPGLLFPESIMQTSFLKDLVTLADPTSPYSFLSFLFVNKRMYRFMNANFPRVARREFNQYLRWVCDSLPNLEFGREVVAITLDDDALVVGLDNKAVRTKNVILGSGLNPIIPDCARPHLGSTVFHASRYLKQDIRVKEKRVAVIGGGQTGAEVFFHLLSNSNALPSKVFWISRRSNFLPLDESPFVNELFTPSYSDYFFGLQSQEKQRLLEAQKLASDGIKSELLENIYRRLYELEFLEGHKHLGCLYPGHELRRMSADSGGWVLEIQDRLSDQWKLFHVDLVVLCTGFEHLLPSYLEPLIERIPWGRDGFSIRDDFSIEWDGPASLKIYVQNAARHSRGIADPNLSLMAWRSATIINSLAGRCVYDIIEANSVFKWLPSKSPKEVEDLSDDR